MQNGRDDPLIAPEKASKPGSVWPPRSPAAARWSFL